MRIFLNLVLGAAVSISTGMACGPVWNNVPVNRFDGVNEWGYVSWWKKIGEVDFGANLDGTPLKLPLIANFRSNRESNSPILGKGWMLALLESHFIPYNEKGTFVMVEPSGHNRYFVPSAGKNSLLIGGGGWVAEVKGNVATAWADCGWKVRYVKGKLDAIFTPKNRRLDIVWENGRPVEIRENSETKLKVQYDGFLNEASALVMSDGRKITLTPEMRPRYERIVAKGASEQTAIDRSLTKVALPDESSFQFEYGLEGKRHPSITIRDSAGNDRVLAWDAETKRIVRDGEWRYEITPGEKPGDYAAIKRTNRSGKSEFWHKDKGKGIETFVDLSGTKTVWTRFAAGKLAGRLRKIETTKDGKTSTQLALNYGPDGRVTREVSPLGELVPKYDEKGRFVAKIKTDGHIAWQRKFDDKNRVVLEESPGFRRESREYFPDGGYLLTVHDKSSGFHAKARPAEKKEYDAKGRHVARWDDMGVEFRFHRDEEGRVDGVFYAGKLREHTVFDKAGRKVMKVHFLPQSERLFYVTKYSYEEGEGGKISRRVESLRPGELSKEEQARIVTASLQFGRNAWGDVKR